MTRQVLRCSWWVWIGQISILFRPKRTDYSLLYRASRASNLPLDGKKRTRQNNRNRLQTSLSLPTHSDLEIEAIRKKDLEFNFSQHNQI